jgi:hypothetical protein
MIHVCFTYPFLIDAFRVFLIKMDLSCVEDTAD